MTTIYIDESGDLGMGAKGSSHFIVTAVKIDNPHTNLRYNRIPKKIRQKKLKKKLKEMNELKFTNCSDELRKFFLREASNLDIEIYTLIIKKIHTKAQLKDNLPVLYNYLMKILLEMPLKTVKSDYELHICLDRCMSFSQKENFEAYIKTEFFSVFSNIPNLRITHECSHNNGGLQVTDFICGAFGFKYNSCEGDTQYTELIKDKIILERNDFFKK